MPKENRNGRRGGMVGEVRKRYNTARVRKSQQAKRQTIAAIKLEKGCAICGYRGHPDALHFDHLPEHVKEDDIANLVSNKGWAAVLAEIQKCQVLCANCHAIETASRRRAESEARRAEREKGQLRLFGG